jgi:hypothetical protein
MCKEERIIIVIYTEKDKFTYRGLRLMEVLVAWSERRLLSEIVRIEVKRK